MPTKFSESGYKVITHLIDATMAENLYQYALHTSKTKPALNDNQIPDTPSFYGDDIMEKLSKEMLPRIEQESVLQLYPTYTYFRVYKFGDILHPHTDRPSCEISITLCLGFDLEEIWPIFLRDLKGNNVKISLSPGDAVLYKGTDVLHWRQSFKGTNHAQVFLHYVDQNGPYKEWRNDKRLEINTR